MPLFPATHPTEKDTFIEWIDVALSNARSIVSGLTGDQLRAHPIPSSELTLGWLILHIGEVAEGWLGRAAAAPGGTMYDLIARDQGIDMSYIGKWFAAHPEVPAPQW